MKIVGLQKLTLLDYPGHIACTIFTASCNYRCPFCHNSSLVLGSHDMPSISEAEVMGFLEKRKGTLEGVCITGGEPTLQHDLCSFVKQVKELGYSIKIDTNGSNPDLLELLINEHFIDYVAMDIKNSKEKYDITTGTPNIDLREVEKSVNLLMNGTLPYEFRTTLVKEFHTEDDLLLIGDWLKGADNYFLQDFKDSGNLIIPGLKGFAKQELYHFRNMLNPYFKNIEVRGVD